MGVKIKATVDAKLNDSPTYRTKVSSRVFAPFPFQWMKPLQFMHIQALGDWGLALNLVFV